MTMADTEQTKPEKPAKAPKADKAAKGEKAEKVEKVAKPKEPQAPVQPARLAVFYKDKVVAELQQTLALKNVMEVPRISKITINMGVGEAVADKKIMDNAVADLQKIAGQKPVVTKAKKSIAQFKIRVGYPVGCMVTLRGRRMYEFLDRLISIAIPRIRDFRGISARSFDGRGNFNMGVKEQII